MHYQTNPPQSKTVKIIQGKVLDILYDLKTHKQKYIPSQVMLRKAETIQKSFLKFLWEITLLATILQMLIFLKKTILPQSKY